MALKLRTITVGLIAVFVLGGCSSAQVGPFQVGDDQVDAKYPLKPCKETNKKYCVLQVKGLTDVGGDDLGKRISPIPLGKDGLYDFKEADIIFAHESKTGSWQRPEFGVALAGGGSKASAFSMGVLAGLAESGFLQKADYVSTVSGGGYAGMFLYRYLIKQNEENLSDTSIKQAFNDCIPSKYGRYFNNFQIPNLCREPFKLDVLAKVYPQIPVRYQQDVLSSRYDLKERTWLEGAGSLAYHLGSTAVWLAPHHIGNSLFDWNADTSPSRSAYRRGIFKTYGSPDKNCKRRYIDGLAFWRDWQCVNNPKPSLRFKALSTLYDADVDVPYWIINGTSGHKGAFFGSLFEPLTNWGKTNGTKPDSGRNFFRDSFEMTADGFGSGGYGYTRFIEPPLNLPNAVAAAAAFFDSQERNAKGPLRGLAAAGQTAFGLNWGMDIDNPLATDEVKLVHRALPWPLYRAHGFTRGPDSVDIHISDGGMSENLGLYALLRRGVKNIVIADAAQDKRGEMGDICFIRNRLLHFSTNTKDADRLLAAHNGQRLHIKFPSLTNFDEICQSRWNEESRKDRMTYDIWGWKNQVVTGCIVITEDEKGSNLPCDSDSDKILSKLFLVKPALDKNNLFRAASSPCTLDDIYQFKEARKNSKGAKKPGCMNDSTPWELAGFLSDKVKNPFKEPCPKFPQDGTVFLTINSDPFHFGAYRELGRVSAKTINLSGNGVEKIDNIKQAVRKLASMVKAPTTCMSTGS